MIERINSTYQSELLKRENRNNSAALRKKAAFDFKSVLEKELQRPDQGGKKA